VPQPLILGIETSCDETSAAVVRGGTEVLSNVVASQLIHADYGGVVPELASREHLRAIVPVVREALHRASAAAGRPITYAGLDAIAVTAGPGLAGALLVGITFAKSLAFALDKPLIAVNHLEGHIHAVLMQTPATDLSSRPESALFADAAERPAVESATTSPLEPRTSNLEPRTSNLEPRTSSLEPAPLLALVVSGGHTHLYLATQTPHHTWTYRNVGKTLDDAAGEAFDKAAKLLGLPYPGGPWIDALAAHANPAAVPFPLAQIKQKATGNTAPKLSREAALAPDDDPTRFDLSFSGLKTALRRHVELHALQPSIALRQQSLRAAGLDKANPRDPATLTAALTHFDRPTLDLIASFQSAIVRNLTRATFAAATHFAARAILVSGGVSANSALRASMTALAAQRGLPIAFPTVALSTDNAAMIAAAAWAKLLAQDFAPDTLEPTPQLRLG
jgi:N6-L-threonylcarbamoyladenine synthase